MRGYTKIPNDLLIESQLSIQARYLLCVLFRYCGKDESCWPSQKTLAKDLGCSDRYVRDLLTVLIAEKLVVKKRSGWNRSNTYTISKTLVSVREPIPSSNDGNSKENRNPRSSHLGTMLPIPQGSPVPPNSIYLKGKDNNSFNQKGLEKVRETLIKKGLIPNSRLKLKSADLRLKVR